MGKSVAATFLAVGMVANDGASQRREGRGGGGKKVGSKERKKRLRRCAFLFDNEIACGSEMEEGKTTEMEKGKMTTQSIAFYSLCSMRFQDA